MKLHIPWLPLLGLILQSCTNQFEFKPFIEQNGQLYTLPDPEVNLKAEPFNILIGFEGWEMQSTDTILQLSYIISDDLNKLASFQDESTRKKLLPENPDLSAEQIKQAGSAASKNPHPGIVYTCTFGRDKGVQFCHFHDCEESPGLLKLRTNISTVNDLPMDKLGTKRLAYLVKVQTPRHVSYLSGTLHVR